ncbi:MAG: hypothetical protein C0483_23920 [Pirellula sp.]|nr:hypothetical protein [Pirellula sp.]
MGAMFAVALLAGQAGAIEPLRVDGLAGPVTAAELQAFKAHVRELPAPTDNLRNAMVYGSGALAAESIGRVYEICGDRDLLDELLRFTDRMLAARNDPKTGWVTWTGERELVWPNAAPVDGKPVYAGAEMGDVVGHIAYAAKLILQQPELAQLPTTDGDPFHFGRTYRARAEHYVRELDRTMDTFLVKHLVRASDNRYYFPTDKRFAVNQKPGPAERPVPWNQQMMLNNGFQRMAECHALLGDAPERVRRYEAIVQASVDWFFENAERITVDGHPCYRWAYVAETPLKHLEDSAHGSYDVGGLYRAYLSGKYGITPAMMAPLANTALYVMATPDGKFTGRTDGTDAAGRPPGTLRSYWLDACEFAPELLPKLYEVNRGRIKSSPELTAGIFWQRHRAALPAK